MKRPSRTPTSTERVQHFAFAHCGFTFREPSSLQTAPGDCDGCVSVCCCVRIQPSVPLTSRGMENKDSLFLSIVSLLKIRRTHFKRLPVPPPRFPPCRDLEIFHQQREEKQKEVCTEFLLDCCCRSFFAEWMDQYLSVQAVAHFWEFVIIIIIF